MRLIQGDCLEEMQNIPDGSIDAVICDPPYGTTSCKWDSVIPLEPMWKQLKRVVKENGAIVLFGSQPFSSALVMSNPKMFKYEWIWDKKLGSGSLNVKRQPLKRHESILVFGNKVLYHPLMRTGRYRNKSTSKPETNRGAYGEIKHVRDNYNDQYYPTSILDFSNANVQGRVHPTQKPTGLMEYLIKTYTNEGDTVLDFAMGSGTTGVACKNLNRNFIGIELDRTYFELAKERTSSL